MVLPEFRGEEFVQQIFRIILLGLDLLQHDALFLENVLGVKQRVQDQVAEHIERLGEVLIQHHGAEADTLLGGEGVQVPPMESMEHAICSARAVAGSLEQHVLDEVGDAASRRISCREPVLSQMPSETERTCGMDSVSRVDSVRQLSLANVAIILVCHR